MRALTFNIRHGVGLDGVHDLERAARVIEGAAADVVALQEVDRHLGPRSGYLDQASWLADRLGLHMAYGPVVDLGPAAAGPDGARRQYGIALLSRLPLREPRNLLLTRPRGGEQRGLLGAAVDVDGRAVRVFCTHLQHRSRTERLAQATQIAESMAAGSGPLVVMGDLNARPGDPEIAPLTDTLDDAWGVAGDGAGFSFDAATPHARIDYILTSGLTARSAEVLPTDASDHLAVVAELDVGTAGPAGLGESGYLSTPAWASLGLPATRLPQPTSAVHREFRCWPCRVRPPAIGGAYVPGRSTSRPRRPGHGGVPPVSAGVCSSSAGRVGDQGVGGAFPTHARPGRVSPGSVRAPGRASV